MTRRKGIAAVKKLSFFSSRIGTKPPRETRGSGCYATPAPHPEGWPPSTGQRCSSPYTSPALVELGYMCWSGCPCGEAIGIPYYLTQRRPISRGARECHRISKRLLASDQLGVLRPLAPLIEARRGVGDRRRARRRQNSTNAHFSLARREGVRTTMSGGRATPSREARPILRPNERLRFFAPDDLRSRWSG